MATNIYDMLDTWNSAATLFASIKMNISDGVGGNPSGTPDSKMISLQTNGTERFGVRIPNFVATASTTPFMNLVDIWNTSGSIVGMSYAVTETASPTESIYLQLTTNNLNIFQVKKLNRLILGNASATTTYEMYIHSSAGQGIRWGFGQSDTCEIAPSAFSTSFLTVRHTGGVIASSSWNYCWSSSASGGTTFDTAIARDAANTIGIRNSTAAQKLSIYNTFTNSTTYERFAIDWQTTSNWAKLGTEAQTGTLRDWYLVTNTLIGLGGTTALFPAFKQDGNGVSFWKADNSIGTYSKDGVMTVASLPTATSAGVGAHLFVTDALGPVFGVTVASGGAVATPVYADAAGNWRVG